METHPIVSFEDTEVAFAYKTNKDLKTAYWLYRTMHYPWLVRLGTALTPMALRIGLPIEGLMRRTIFKQFVGGESLEQTTAVVQKLAQYGVQVILDYGVEGKEGEANFDHGRDVFIKVIHFAATQPNIPFMSVKVTGIARFGLLEKLDALMEAESGDVLQKYNAALRRLSAAELAEWQRVHERLEQISQAAQADGVGFLIDAEDSWIQDPVDALTTVMMEQFNRERVIVYNTFQLYRHDRLAFLQQSLRLAEERGFLLGAKLVRGAYMEKERARAAQKGYPSPIQPDKEATDADYNEAVRFCMEHLDKVSVMIASHNDQSNHLGVKLLQEKGLGLNHPHVHFSQLYGMSDNITYNLAKAGCNVSKYLPFGPIKDVVPYLMRRAQENTSVGGQTGRELSLIQEEMRRRGM